MRLETYDIPRDSLHARDRDRDRDRDLDFGHPFRMT
jgi:hypothetical protein